MVTLSSIKFSGTKLALKSSPKIQISKEQLSYIEQVKELLYEEQRAALSNQSTPPYESSPKATSD